MYCEMAEGRANMSSFKLMVTKSTDMVVGLKVSCDRKSLHLPTMKSVMFKREVLKKSVFINSNVR
jgi:hypothetical protein